MRKIRSSKAKNKAKINSSEVEGFEPASQSEDSAVDLSQIDRPVESLSLRKGKKQRKKFRLRFVIFPILIIILLVGGFFAYKVLNTGISVFRGGLGGLFTQTELKTDANGRTNVLIFGTAEDDEGGTHEGGNLTDSIMVASYRKSDNDFAMISLPRDLWVELGQLCSVGNQAKINTVYFCGSDDGANPQTGAEALSKKVSEILGLEIQYYVHLNFTAVVELVDAVGGVDVEVKGEGPVPYGVKPGSILDRNFDWKCNYQCHYVKYEPGTHHMDGEHALAFMRARNASGGYGLPQSNFNREKNQQKVLSALIKKLTSSSTLTNFNSLLKILEALGSNLKTNISTSELGAGFDLIKKLDLANLQENSIGLQDDKDSPLVGTGQMYGASVVQPSAGLFNYQQIRLAIARKLSSDPLVKEAAKVVVFNAGDQAGLARQVADKLESAKLEVVYVGNLAASEAGQAGVYRLDDSKPASAKKASQLSGVSEINQQLPFRLDIDADIVVVVKESPPQSGDSN